MQSQYLAVDSPIAVSFLVNEAGSVENKRHDVRLKGKAWRQLSRFWIWIEVFGWKEIFGKRNRGGIFTAILHDWSDKAR